ncbi:BirA family biotin operon repressor/biotin-[acetyl-CoA-carboxylase] ligase [Streptosporangium becharense]|uniref:biotin--[biotin carboxyl-carrier protein] ligase n=1 Tax=Streptosporangium becharense TaxID=1816182 RepID=A0A7W9IFJ0_9ACTN|nr:biotin--[acetyl-CoA-carboxylase] ligase [Streptosporangium becharense]MBB2909648.1 BirA family biotin operon repressor/biotin-[acetyl-CoA-carboxylase] ligase [Streptosporangium becharense]MBB5819396.1 BirA family biotin operon repressor/biotin-[acetyl-CoA-carboxylase] ligase [Streptosporangium becharense]
MLDSPFTDLDRPPLSEAALNRALVRPGSLWSGIRVVDRTGSTNADLAQAVRDGARQGAVVIAESQFAGRGRLGRVWSVPPRSGLTFSVLLRPDPSPVRQSWLPLLVGLAVASAVRKVAEVDVRLKWPNDLLIGERKLAGVLAERVDSAVVVGVGLNVSVRAEELPVETATSLAVEEAACVDRDPIIRAALREIEAHYREWSEADGDADACGLRAAYLAASATVGREIRVELPGERVLTGTATGIDDAGHLIVASDGKEHTLSVGDVVHVRPHAS